MKFRPNSVANLGREAGLNIPDLAKSHNGKREINPLVVTNNHKNIFVQTYENFDLNQVCALRVWKNLPPNLSGWAINRMLYYRGALVGFRFNNVVYVLPFCVDSDKDGAINIFGMPNAIRPLTFNGREPTENGGNPFGAPLSLDVNYGGDFNPDSQAFILYDSIPFSPASLPISRHAIDSVYLHQICETLSKIDINIQISNKKIVLIVPDYAQSEAIKSSLERSFKSDSPFIVTSAPIDSSAIQQTSDFNADMLFQTAKNWDSIRCNMNGIPAKAYGFDKKERMITGELDGQNDQVNLIADMRLDLSKEWTEKMNRAFGLHIDVCNRIDMYEEENKKQFEEDEEDEENV